MSGPLKPPAYRVAVPGEPADARARLLAQALLDFPIATDDEVARLQARTRAERAAIARDRAHWSEKKH